MKGDREDLPGYLELTRDIPDSYAIDRAYHDDAVQSTLTIGSIRALAAENKQLREDNLKLTEAVKAAANVIRPLWDAAIKHLSPLWSAIEPLVEEKQQPTARRGVCKVCDGLIEFHEEAAGTTGVAVTRWWEHLKPPLVAHNAVLRSETEPFDPATSSWKVSHVDQPKHGDIGVCAVCGGEIEYVEHQQGSGAGEYEVLDAWWSHHTHPADGHDAQPAPPGFTFVGTVDGGVAFQ